MFLEDGVTLRSFLSLQLHSTSKNGDTSCLRPIIAGREILTAQVRANSVIPRSGSPDPQWVQVKQNECQTHRQPCILPPQAVTKSLVTETSSGINGTPTAKAATNSLHFLP